MQNKNVVLHKWRHWLTWRQGPQPPRARARAREPTVFSVTWETCRRKCRTCVALPKVQRGVQTWRRCPHQVAWPDMASKCGVTCPRGVREPGGVAGRGVKMWRHLPTWRQGARWRGRTWRQNVASGAIDLRGVTGRGVKTWHHEARPPARVFKMCLQSSGVVCTPTGDHLAISLFRSFCGLSSTGAKRQPKPQSQQTVYALSRLL